MTIVEVLSSLLPLVKLRSISIGLIRAKCQLVTVVEVLSSLLALVKLGCVSVSLLGAKS